jgi:hypothetical protein
VIEVAGDHAERVGVERGQQLVLGQPEQLLQMGGRRAQKSWFSDIDVTAPRYRVVEPNGPLGNRSEPLGAGWRLSRRR